MANRNSTFSYLEANNYIRNRLFAQKRNINQQNQNRKADFEQSINKYKLRTIRMSLNL